MPKEEDLGKSNSQGSNEETLREGKQLETSSKGVGKHKVRLMIYVTIAVLILVIIYFVSRQNDQTFIIFK